MRIAITGGTGCLGRPLVERLESDGASIRLLIHPDDTPITCFDKQIEIITGALNVPQSLDMLTRNRDIVFHLAGKAHSVPKTKGEEQEFYRVNVEGTRNLLAAAKKNGVQRVIFYSTVGVYGENADFHGDELSPCRPGSVYAKSKFQAEQLVLNSSRGGGSEGVVLRFPVAYGPLDRGNIAKLIKLVHKKLFVFIGDGNCLRSMISSKNTVEAAIRAAHEEKAANQVFCVTDGRECTMIELVDSICQALGISRRPYHVPVLLADMAGKLGDFLEKWSHISLPIQSDNVRKLSRPLTFSCEKAKKVLGYEPVDTLGKEIRREVEWLYPEMRSTDYADDYTD